ncbi:MAG: protein kinase [Planctomycetota bacterium]
MKPDCPDSSNEVPRKGGSRRPEASAASFFVDNLSFHPDGHLEGIVELPPDTEEYRFQRELGRGGMGLVYACEDIKASREVALKVVIPSLQVSKDALERFEHEARAAASISHPNCVFVYGAHLVHGSPAIAMELMPGRTLEDAIEDGQPMTVKDAVAATLDLLAGLEAAHEKGVMHRDIKPSNLFLDENGRVKLGDFGLSRSFGGDLKLTRTGTFLGTPLYASPEQVRSRDVDERSDLYSVGAVLHALLTGNSPFRATSIGDLFAQIVTEDPPHAREINSLVPHGLDAIIVKSLAKKPEARFATAAEFRAALQPYLESTLKTAPIGVRVAAGVLDYGIISVICLVIYAALALLVDGLANQGNLLTGIVLALAFLWVTFFDARLGGTPAKLLLGLRVRGVEGGQLSLGQSGLRALVILAIEAFDGLGLLWGLSGGLLALALFIPARRKSGWRGLHEFVSKSRTVQVPSRIGRLLKGRKALSMHRRDQTELPAGPEGYEVTARVAFTEAGELFLAREEKLHRQVWLHLRTNGKARRSGDERANDEAYRLHWLSGGDNFDVYEDVGGAAPEEYARAGRVCDWELFRDAIATLARVKGDHQPRPEELWIDGRGHLRILDFARARDAKSHGDAATPSSLIANLTGIGTSQPERLPRFMPEGAALILRQSVKDESLDALEFEGRLAELHDSGDPPTRGLRTAQLAITGLLGVLGFIVAVAIGLGISGFFAFVVYENSGRPDSALPMIMCVGLILGMILPNVGLSWLLRRSPEHAIVGMVLLDRHGERASRTLAASRSLLAWTPLVAFIFLGMLLLTFDRSISEQTILTALFVLYGATLSCIFANGVFALIFPDSSLHDRITKTRFVH